MRDERGGHGGEHAATGPGVVGQATIVVAERDAARQFGRLRKALNAGSERDPILYATGEGYMFDETFGHE